MKRVLSIFAVLLFFILTTSFAMETTFHPPQTIKTPENFYITSGSVAIDAPIIRARSSIEDVHTWNEWMLTGLDGSKKTDRFLLVYIMDLLTPAENTLEAVVDFRFLRNLGKSSEHIPFSLIWQHTNAGDVYKVTASLSKKNAILESAEYEITLCERDVGLSINYMATIKFKGFFEFFVTLRTYKNTIEWYLDKIIENFTIHVKS